MVPHNVYGARGTSWDKGNRHNPSQCSVGTFHGGRPTGFVEIENRINYSPVISRWGKQSGCVVAMYVGWF
jgi:hypothetical protein